MVYRALGFRPSAVSHCIVGHTMDRFFPMKKAVETVTVQEKGEQKWTAEPLEPIFKNWSWWSPTPVLSGPEWV